MVATSTSSQVHGCEPFMTPIVGIGELLWDVFPDGRKVLGGAPFNFAFHCHQLGHKAMIVSRVGDDDLGHELREHVLRLGLSDEFIQQDDQHPTVTVQVTLTDGQPSYHITENVAWDALEWNERLQDLAHNCRAVCFGTLAQRTQVSGTTIRRFVTESQSAKALRVFDANLRQRFYTRDVLRTSCELADIVKVADNELSTLIDLIPLTHFDDSATIEELRQEFDLQAVYLTCGAEGVRFASKDGEIGSVSGVPAQVIDTVGAGDAFTAAMVCGQLEGRTVVKCVRFANQYAAKVCEHRGATPKIDREVLEMMK